MTSAGFERLIELYMDDIETLRYDLDGVTQNTTAITKTASGNTLDIRFTTPEAQNGEYDNFKLITAGGIISTERVLSFEKTSGESIVKFPFVFVNG